MDKYIDISRDEIIKFLNTELEKTLESLHGLKDTKVERIDWKLDGIRIWIKEKSDNG